MLGAAALAGALPEMSRAMPSSNSTDSAPTPEQATDATPSTPDASGDEICDLSAVDLAARIRRKQLSAREVMEAHLARIARVNPKINAIVTLVAERAMNDARKADEHQARGGALGPLHGLPMAHKDLFSTAGIRTTYGSPLFRDYVPTTDALVVKRVRDAGAITLGKTNTPEFGAGSNTFNPVFGATVNPYDVPGWCRSLVGATRADRCAIPRRSRGSSACGRRPVASRTTTAPGRRSRRPVRWRARWRTSPFSSAP